MTPADLAMKNAIAFECKKDGLRQTQAGTWKVTFTVLDMDERLTKAFPGTRYQAVLVEIDDNELPIHQPKEVMPHPTESNVTGLHNAQPQSEELDKRPAGAKREKMDWRELQPAAQSAIRCADPVFRRFLSERQHIPVGQENAPDVVRFICGVKSRSELGTNAKAHVIWHQLDSAFLAWKYVDA